ncbi:MAG: PKD-like domain-containing protein, partial [Bacteroidota bacterium]
MNNSSLPAVYRIAFFSLFFLSCTSLLAQPGATQARHETTAQTSTEITLTAPLGAGGYTCLLAPCLANWSITIGGVPGTISTVIGGGLSSLITVAFTPAVGIGQAVIVNHTNDGTVNNIVNLVSQNNKVIFCADFTWFAVNTPTPVCVPVHPITKMVFSVTPGARNSSLWNIGNLKVRAHWIANGAAPFNDLVPFGSDNAGNPVANTYFISGNAAPSPWTYNPADLVCGYTSTWRVQIGLASCPFTNPGQQVTYAAHNNDDEGVGADVILMPIVINSDRVCVGTNVNMNFSDNTDLNCNPQILPIPTNDDMRWVRVVYGSTDLGPGNTALDNIPNIRVDGVPVTDGTGLLTSNLAGGGYVPPAYPFGVPDPFGVVLVPAAVTTPRGILNLITTSSTVGQVVGQKFWVRIDYWNVCNMYDGAGDAILNNKKSIENEIEIIGKPLPLTTAGLSICYSTGPQLANGFIAFTAASASGTRTAVNWYRNLADYNNVLKPKMSNGGAPPTNLLTMTRGTYNAQGGLGQPMVNNNTAGEYYSVFVTQVESGSPTCESDPIEIVIFQQPNINTLAADIRNIPTPSPAPDVCNGATVVYTEGEAVPIKSILINNATNPAQINFNTENAWSHTFPATVTITPSATPSPTASYLYGIVAQPLTFTDATIGVALRYVTPAPPNVTVTTNFPAPAAPAFYTYVVAPQACTNTVTTLAQRVYSTSSAGTIAPATGSPQTICEGGAYTAPSIGSVPTPIRQTAIAWQKQVDGGGFADDAALGTTTTMNTVALPIVVAFTPAVYQFRAKVVNGGTIASPICVAAFSAITQITVNPKATSATLNGGATICAGSSSNLNVTVAGSTTATYTVVILPGPINVPGYTPGNPISVTPGSTTVYSLSSVTDSRNCTVFAVNGTPTVTVNNPPVVTTPPVNRIICEDASTTFSVVATGTSLLFQWQRDPNTTVFANITDGVTDGVLTYSGATTNTLTVNASGLGVTLNNYKYRCVITGVCPPSPINSAQASLTVNPKASITTQPISGPNICINGTKIFTVVAAGTADLTYQWQEDPDGGGGAPFANLADVGAYSGVTTASLTINTTGLGTTLSGHDYRVLVNSTGCPSADVTSNTVTLTQQGPITSITQGATGSVCVGNNLQLNGVEIFFGGGTNVSSVWSGTLNAVVLTVPELDALLTDGLGGSRRTALDPIFNAAVIGTYVLTLTTIDNFACTNTAVITIMVSQVVAAPIYSSATCSGIAVPINGNPSGGSGIFAGGASMHTWTKVSGPGGAIGTLLSDPNIQNPVFSTTSVISDVYVLRYFVQDNVGCNFITSGASDVTITVNPLPSATNQAPAAICSTVALGTTAIVDLTALNIAINAGSGVTTTIAWFSDAGFTVPIATPATATVSNAVAVFARVTQNATSCVNSATATYTVDPRPATPTLPVNVTACSDVVATTAISATVAGGSTIDWYAAATGGAVLAGGAGTTSFTPGVIGTYHAEARDMITGCVSTSRLPVSLASDAIPPAATVGATQITCSDVATLTGNAPAPGTGTWTVANAIYYETFSTVDNGIGAIGGAGVTAPASGNWSIDITNAVLVVATDFLKVTGGQMVAQDVDNDVAGQYIEWQSSVINIAAFPGGVDLSLDVSSTAIVGDDGMEFFYRLNGAAPVSFNPALGPANFSQTVTETGIIAATLQIILRIELAGPDAQNIQFDNVIVKPSSVSGIAVITDANLFNSGVTNLQDGDNDFTWTIVSGLGVCAPTNATLRITKNAQAASANINQDLCETVFGSGTTNAYDLNVHNLAVSNMVAGMNVTWFLDANLTMAVGTPTSVNISDNDIYYARIEDLVTLCTNASPILNPGSVTFNIDPLPTVTNPAVATRTFCEDTQGAGSHAGVNLQLYEAVINGTGTITWYPTLADAVALANEILPGPAVGQVGNFTVFDGSPIIARVIDGNSCVNYLSVDFVVSPLPADNIIDGNTIDCSDPVAPKIYSVSSALNAFGTTHLYNWNINGAGINFEVFDGVSFITSNNYTLPLSTSFLIIVRFPNAGAFTFSASETIDGCTGNTVNLVANISGAPPALVFTQAPTDVCKGETGVVYEISGGVPQGGSNYIWTVVGGSIIGPASGNIASITVDWGTIIIPQPSVSVTESNASGCAGAPVSTNVFLFDNPVMSSPSSITICGGSAPFPVLTFAATLGGLPPVSGVTFNWEVVSVPVNVTGVVVTQTGTGQLIMPLANVSGVSGIVTFEVTPIENDLPNPPNCTSLPQTVFIEVLPKPVIVPAQSTLICNNTSPNYSVQLTPATLPVTTVLSWAAPTMSAGPAQGSAEAGIAIGGAGTPHIMDVLTNSTTANISATYNVVASNGACSYLFVPVVINIEPAPQASILNPTILICTGDNVNITISTPATSVGAQTFDVAVSSTNPGATAGTAFTALAAQTYPLNIAGTLTNSSNSFITVTFTVTPKIAGCANGLPVNTTVQVEPTPNASVVNTAAVVCNGGNANIAISNLTTPTTPGNLSADITVSSDNPGATGGTAFTTLPLLNQTYPISSITGDLTNSSDVFITLTYTITPKLLGCPDGTPITTTVRIEPTPKAAINNTDFVISNGGNTAIAITTPSVSTNLPDLQFDLAVSSSNGPATGGTAFAALSNQSYPLNLTGTLTNSSTSVITVTFTVTPELNNAGLCTDGTDVVTTVQVEPTPSLSVSNLTPLIPNGSNVNITISSTTPVTVGAQTFDVVVSSSDLGATGGTAFADLIGQTYPQNIGGTLTNSSNSVITVTYTVTPKIVDCPDGTPVVTTVMVEPTPNATVVNSKPVVCNGGNADISITNITTPFVPGNLRADITVSSDNPGATGGTAFTTMPLLNQTYPISSITGTLTNSSDAFITLTYTITPKLLGNPDGTPIVTTVKIEPTPKALINNTDMVICNGGNTAIEITTPTTSTNLPDLQFDVAVGSSNGPATGGTAFAALSNQSYPFNITGTLTNSSASVITVTFTVTPELNNASLCTDGTPVVTTVQVEPTPLATVTNNDILICNAANVDIDIANANPSTVGARTFDVGVGSSNPGATGGGAFIALLAQTYPLNIGGTLTNSSNAVITVTYTVTPKIAGCADGTPIVTTVQVEPTPIAVLTNFASVICNNGNANITVTSPTVPTSPGTDLRFNIIATSSDAPSTSGTAFVNTNNVSFPFTINGTLINTSNNIVTVTFEIIPLLSGCPNGTSVFETVDVEPTPSTFITNTTPRVCNADPVNVVISSLSTPTIPANLRFDLAATSSNPGVTGGTAFADLINQAFPVNINGTLTNSSNAFITVTFTVTPKYTGCNNGTAVVTTVKVEPTPTASFVNNLPKVCNLGTPNITITSPTTTSVASDLTFDVTVTLPGGVTGTLLAGNGIAGATAPFSINTGVLTNANNNFETVIYTITPKLAGCVDGPLQVVNVIVEPTPQADVPVNNLPVICNGGSPSIDVTSPTAPSVAGNLTFDVSVSLPAGISGTGIAGSGVIGASAPFSINAGTLTNSTNTFKTVTYTITPKLSGCTNGPTKVVNVIVEPTPQAAISNTAAVVCNGGNVNLTITSPTTPNTPANLTFDLVATSSDPGNTGGTAFADLLAQSFPLSIN